MKIQDNVEWRFLFYRSKLFMYCDLLVFLFLAALASERSLNLKDTQTHYHDLYWPPLARAPCSTVPVLSRYVTAPANGIHARSGGFSTPMDTEIRRVFFTIYYGSMGERAEFDLVPESHIQTALLSHISRNTVSMASEPHTLGFCAANNFLCLAHSRAAVILFCRTMRTGKHS